MKAKLAALLALVILGCGATAAPAAAKGIGSAISPEGIYREGSPFRYVALSPGFPDKLTVVARINRRGGKVKRWWYLPGGYYVPAAALDGTATGLATDGRTLVLTEHEAVPYRAPRRTTLAIMETDRPRRPTPGQPRDPFVHFAHLKGEWALLAIAPDGAHAYLSRYRIGVERIGPHLYRPLHPGGALEVRVLDTASGELLPGRVRDRDGNQTELDGIPYAQVGDRAGRWTYTLYVGDRGQSFVYALDAVHGIGTRVNLAHQGNLREPYALHLRLEDEGRTLRLVRRWFPDGKRRERTLALVDTGALTVQTGEPQATASVASIGDWAWRFVSTMVTERAAKIEAGRGRSRTAAVLAAFEPPPGAHEYAALQRQTVGRSAGGRKIALMQIGDPTIEGRVLVFGCIHGDECAAKGLRPLGNAGCPDPDSNVFVVPNLDPDGVALGTRLNGRGVDLNRNFPVAWRPIGERGDPEYAGPRPFSEPESRLTARIVRALEPRMTIWFHQHRGAGAYVRAWGASAPAGREYAAAAGIRFRLMPWLAGTGPHWQNQRFPGTASFVVELPPGELTPGLETRLGKATVRLAQRVGED